MDVLSIIYNALMADEYIASQAAGKIKYYDFPEVTEIGENPHIIIEPVDVPLPRDFADNQYLTYDILINIETWSKNRILTKDIADRIEAILWDLGLVQNGGLDEYDSDVFRNARRYRGKIYRDAVI